MYPNQINLPEGMSSEFSSPIYKVKKVKVWDLVGQNFNPNTLNSKAFAALQISIFNNGYAMSITASENPIFSEEFSSKLSPKERIDLCIQGAEGDAKSGAIGHDSDSVFATQVSDDSIRKAFRYQIVDGSQRSGIIRLGTKYFMEDSNITSKIEKWKNGDSIPSEPGKEMLKYLAWREDFTLPCAILEGKSDAEMMSATILFNPVHENQEVMILRGVKECPMCHEFHKLGEDGLCKRCSEK